MFKAGDMERFGDILQVTIVAERMFLRLQFNAESDEEKRHAENARRNAIGLRKAVEEWPGLTPPAP